MSKNKELFIGSSKEGLKYARKLKASLDSELCKYGIKCTLWEEDGVFLLGRATIENLCKKGMELRNNNGYALMIMTPDDEVKIRGETKYAPRDNVIFEMGLFLGYLGRERTYCVFPSNKNIKLMSDWSGITNATYKYAKTARNIDQRLEMAVHAIVCTIDSIEHPKVNNATFNDITKNSDIDDSEVTRNIFRIIENNIDRK